jgi:hypothetical protein
MNDRHALTSFPVILASLPFRGFSQKLYFNKQDTDFFFTPPFLW